MRDHLEESYAQFVLTRQDHLRTVAFALCGDWHRAEDLLQTAFVKLYLAWPRVHEFEHPEAYVRKILVRANIDEHRRPWRRREVSTDRHIESPASVGEDALEERDVLIAALRALTARQRACVVMRHWLELSTAETAEALGISEGAVKTHASRGRERLRELLPALALTAAERQAGEP